MDNGARSYRRFLDGDDEGLTEIVRDYKDGLILFLNGFVSNIWIAEELMEETFFKIITKRPRFSEKYAFKTWLYTVGRNVAIDYLRHHAGEADIPIEDVEHCLKDACDLEKQYMAGERKVMLHRALQKLHPEYRQVLWLIYLEGFSNADAAAVMKKNSRQMKNLLYRAKSALKSELDKEGFTYEAL